MSFDRKKVVNEAVEAMRGVLGDKIALVLRVAPFQAALLLENARIIEDATNGLSDEERETLKQVSARAARDVLTAYDAISFAAAEQAVAAAWEVIISALEAAV